MTNVPDDALKQGQKVTLVGALGNALLIGVKLIGGIFGHSQALIADAVHSASDFITDAVVLIGLKLGDSAPDDRHHFGHARLETLASAVVGLTLIGIGVGLAYDSGLRIYHREAIYPTWPAAVVAAISVIAKESLYRYTIIVGRRIKSMALQANAWHHRSDAFSSVAVLIGLTAALIRPEWHILDAYAALLVSVLIIKVGVDVLLTSVREFTDTAPSPEVMSEIKACAMKVPGVINIHDLKVRTAGGLYHMELHVMVNGELTVIEGHRIAKTVEACLFDEVEDTERIIIHIDPDEPSSGEETQSGDKNGPVSME